MSSLSALDRLVIGLNPYIGTTAEVMAYAKQLFWLGKKYQKVQEEKCTLAEDAALSWREERLERQISAMAEKFPQPDEGKWAVRFQSDPRGRVVILVAPDGAEITVY